MTSQIHKLPETIQRYRSNSSRSKADQTLSANVPRAAIPTTSTVTTLGSALARRPSNPRTASAPTISQIQTKPRLSPDFSHDLNLEKAVEDDTVFLNHQKLHNLPQDSDLTTTDLGEKGEVPIKAYITGISQKTLIMAAQDVCSPSFRTQTEHRIATDSVQSTDTMNSINIAVIGGTGVGKSTLIQRALGLRSLPTSVTSSMRMSVDNVVYTVSLLELDLESFDVDPDRRIQWPKQINGQITPRIDGSLILYDVMNRDSLSDLPQTLILWLGNRADLSDALVNSALPTILVSCKVDNPKSIWQINADSIEAACMAEVQVVKTASNVPESARLCLGAMLRAIMACRNNPRNVFQIVPGRRSYSRLEVLLTMKGQLLTTFLAILQDNPASRRRAASSSKLETGVDKQELQPDSQHSKHSRASSEVSLLKGGLANPLPNVRVPPPLTHKNHLNRTNLHYQYAIPAAHTAPPLSSHPAFRNRDLDEGSDSEFDSPGSVALHKTEPLDSISGNCSFLDMEESDLDTAIRRSDDVPILQRSETEKSSKSIGLTFAELVDRLLGQRMAKADSNFEDIFLCLYRKFAAPIELFQAITTRFDQAAGDGISHFLTRTSTQLRIITIVAKWVSTYPGDFASTQASQKLNEFIEQLSMEPAFKTAAAEMRTELQLRVIEDDDTGWARTDATVEAELDSIDGAALQKIGTNNDAHDQEPRVAKGRPLSLATTASGDSNPLAQTPSHQGYHSFEDYEAEAARLVPTSLMPLTRFRWHMCMEISEDDFAAELTRIDWIMFSAIRMRDFVRHVSLPLAERSKCKSLANVDRMSGHFNHIAKWVANMILIRDKAKHRALMLEKFMTIALKLRQLNNYNGLAAIIAGINGAAVHRLANTRALIPPESGKRFMRLELLMGTQKSHFAYRLAWENSSLPRIPFIPLHRRDLVSAEEGSRTFVGLGGELINWKKFEVLAEVILPIMKSQSTPYPKLEKHEGARELILDCKMELDDEEIYNRSCEVESQASVASSLIDAGKKRFNWFQKT